MLQIFVPSSRILSRREPTGQKVRRRFFDPPAVVVAVGGASTATTPITSPRRSLSNNRQINQCNNSSLRAANSDGPLSDQTFRDPDEDERHRERQQKHGNENLRACESSPVGTVGNQPTNVFWSCQTFRGRDGIRGSDRARHRPQTCVRLCDKQTVVSEAKEVSPQMVIHAGTAGSGDWSVHEREDVSPGREPYITGGSRVSVGDKIREQDVAHRGGVFSESSNLSPGATGHGPIAQDGTCTSCEVAGACMDHVEPPAMRDETPMAECQPHVLERRYGLRGNQVCRGEECRDPRSLHGIYQLWPMGETYFQQLLPERERDSTTLTGAYREYGCVGSSTDRRPTSSTINSPRLPPDHGGCWRGGLDSPPVFGSQGPQYVVPILGMGATPTSGCTTGYGGQFGTVPMMTITDAVFFSPRRLNDAKHLPHLQTLPLGRQASHSQLHREHRYAKLMGVKSDEMAHHGDYLVWEKFLRLPRNSDWPLHAAKIDTLLPNELLHMARPHLLEPLLIALKTLTDATIYNASHCDVDLCPRSPLTETQIRQIVDNELAISVPRSLVRSWGIFRTVPEESKRRFRLVTDFLPGNTVLPDFPKLIMNSLQELEAMVVNSEFAVTFDFRAYFHQFAVCDDVSYYMCFRHRNEYYRYLRGPMGHKYMVFTAQVSTSVLADVQEPVYCDIIYDNTLFAGSHADVSRAAQKFRDRCLRAHVTIGEASQVTQNFTHRGIDVDLSITSWRLKSSWSTKFSTRFSALRTNQFCAPLPVWHSLFGMIAWALGVMRWPITTFYGWRWLARHIARNSRVDICPWPSALDELSDIADRVSQNEYRSLRTHLDAACVLVTDASKTPPFAAWGAVLIDLPTGKYRTARGDFPLNSPQSINELELTAVARALDLFATFLRKTPDLLIFLDNQAAQAVLGSWTTPNFFMFRALREVAAQVASIGLDRNRIKVRRVPSEENPADPGSRGRDTTDEDILRFLEWCEATTIDERYYNRLTTLAKECGGGSGRDGVPTLARPQAQQA